MKYNNRPNVLKHKNVSAQYILDIGLPMYKTIDTHAVGRAYVQNSEMSIYIYNISKLLF